MADKPVVFGEFPASVSFEFVRRVEGLDLELLSPDVTAVSKHPEILSLSRIYESQFLLLLGVEGVHPFALFCAPPLRKRSRRVFGYKLFLDLEEEELSSDDNRFVRIIDAQLRPAHQTLALFEKDRGALRELFRIIDLLNEYLEYAHNRRHTVRG